MQCTKVHFDKIWTGKKLHREFFNRLDLSSDRLSCMQHTSVVLAPKNETSGTLMTINMPPVSIPGAHTTLLGTQKVSSSSLKRLIIFLIFQYYICTSKQGFVSMQHCAVQWRVFVVFTLVFQETGNGSHLQLLSLSKWNQKMVPFHGRWRWLGQHWLWSFNFGDTKLMYF